MNITSDVIDLRPALDCSEIEGVVCYSDNAGLALATFGQESEPRKKQVSKREIPTWMYRNKPRRFYATV